MIQAAQWTFKRLLIFMQSSRRNGKRSILLSFIPKQIDTTDKCNSKQAKQKRYLVQQSICYLLFHQLGDKTYDRRLVIYDALYLQILPTYILQLVTDIFTNISVMTMFSQNLVLSLLDCTRQVQLFVHKFSRSTQVHSVGCFKCWSCFGLYSDVV